MLNFSYISIFIFLIIVIYLAIRKIFVVNKLPKLRKVTILYFGGIFMWVVYLYFISNNGFLFDKSFPPKFFIYIFAPLILILISLLYRLRKSKLIKLIPITWPVYIQIFRIPMELIILMTFYANIIPIQATFLGYNFEIIFALSAPIIGYFVFSKSTTPIKVGVVWNIIGIFFLLIVVTITVTSFFKPELWGSKDVLIDVKFTELPFLLLPAFMVPCALLIHGFSILQILKIK